MMTGPGTNTYLFGADKIAVVDPGPMFQEHIDRIRTEAAGDIEWILVTHTHPDHSPAAMPLAALTGAEVLGIAAPEGPHQDATFEPHRILADGDALVTDEFKLEAIHTPGHASNHLCYRHAATNWLVTGDHVIDGLFNGAHVGDLLHAFTLDDLRRVATVRPDDLEEFLGDLTRDVAGTDQVDDTSNLVC